MRFQRFVTHLPLVLAMLFAAGVGTVAGATTSGQILGLPDTNLAVYGASGKNLLLGANAGTQMTFTSGGGVQVGSPTGGDKGAGTINATALYVGGSAVVGGTSTLAQILASGNTTGGANLVVSSGDVITGAAAADLTVKAPASQALLLGGNNATAVKFDTNNNVILNNTGSALTTGATNGFSFLPTCAGVPTGVPAATPTGAAAWVYDSTNNRVYVYNGGWVNETSVAGASTLQQAYTAGNTITTAAAGAVSITGAVNSVNAVTIVQNGTTAACLGAKGPQNVQGTTHGTMGVGDTTALAAGSGGGIVFQAITDGTTTQTTIAGIHGEKENATSSNTAGALVFDTKANGSNPAEAGRWTSAGVLQFTVAAPTITTSATNAGLSCQPNGSGYFQVLATATTTGTTRYNVLIGDTTAFATGVGGGIMFQCKVDAVPTYMNGPGIAGIKENATSANTACALVFSTHATGATGSEAGRFTSAGALNLNAVTTVGSAGQIQGVTTIIGNTTLTLNTTSNNNMVLSAGSGVIDTTASQIKMVAGTTGAGTALLSTNCPAVTVSAPFTWLKLQASDGSQVYVPCWKRSRTLGTAAVRYGL